MGSHEDRILRLLSDSRSREILTTIDDAGGPFSLTELAERLTAREEKVFRGSEYEQRYERTLISLHHDRLPKLDDVGLIAYDPEENVVSPDGYATVDPDWSAFEMFDDVLSRFGGVGSDEGAVGVIEGREDVYKYARRIADEADEELFLIYVSDDLLDEECLPQAKNAIDRGIDFRVGSQNPDVRDFFRTHLPEATIWEPQLDWMNDPSRYPRVDRLILADREKVAFSLLDEPAADGTSTETAMVGQGVDNPLVVLVRELLGPRLDHLDYQSESFRGELPF